MSITDSYLQAGYKCTKDTASSNGSTLLATTKIQKELSRLSKLHESKTISDYVSPFKDRFMESIAVLDDLMAKGNDYVRLSAVKEILDRVSPKVTRNESVKYTLPAKEKDRIAKLISIRDVTVDNSATTVDNSAQIP
jgi:phage terminase small subunit